MIYKKINFMIMGGMKRAFITAYLFALPFALSMDEGESSSSEVNRDKQKSQEMIKSDSAEDESDHTPKDTEGDISDSSDSYKNSNPEKELQKRSQKVLFSETISLQQISLEDFVDKAEDDICKEHKWNVEMAEALFESIENVFTSKKMLLLRTIRKRLSENPSTKTNDLFLEYMETENKTEEPMTPRSIQSIREEFEAEEQRLEDALQIWDLQCTQQGQLSMEKRTGKWEIYLKGIDARIKKTILETKSMENMVEKIQENREVLSVMMKEIQAKKKILLEEKEEEEESMINLLKTSTIDVFRAPDARNPRKQQMLEALQTLKTKWNDLRNRYKENRKIQISHHSLSSGLVHKSKNPYDDSKQKISKILTDIDKIDVCISSILLRVKDIRAGVDEKETETGKRSRHSELLLKFKNIGEIKWNFHDNKNRDVKKKRKSIFEQLKPKQKTLALPSASEARRGSVTSDEGESQDMDDIPLDESEDEEELTLQEKVEKLEAKGSLLEYIVDNLKGKVQSVFPEKIKEPEKQPSELDGKYQATLLRSTEEEAYEEAAIKMTTSIHKHLYNENESIRLEKIRSSEERVKNIGNEISFLEELSEKMQIKSMNNEKTTAELNERIERITRKKLNVLKRHYKEEKERHLKDMQEMAENIQRLQADLMKEKNFFMTQIPLISVFGIISKYIQGQDRVGVLHGMRSSLSSSSGHNLPEKEGTSEDGLYTKNTARDIKNFLVLIEKIQRQYPSRE